jgi:transcriptional regulator with XRE-family HTH domain
MNAKGSRPRSKLDLAALDADALLRELTERDPSFAEGAAIYDLVNKVSGLLKQMRNFAELTQSGLAERLGVTQGRISQIESGLPDHAPSLEMIARIALACGVTPQVSFDPSALPREKGTPAKSMFGLAAAPAVPAVTRVEVKRGGSS